MSTLSFTLVTAKDATPSAWLLFLHGILGRGANWTTIARRLTGERPEWGAALVDLRMHGASQGFPPPHTIDAAAADLEQLVLPGPVRGVVGHSFGGKVALAYAHEHPGLAHVFLMDSNPGARPEARGSEATLAVLDLLGSLPKTFPTREDFTKRIRDAGHSESLAQWLAVNLTRAENGFALRLDLAAIRALLEDYFARDLWTVLEHPPEPTRFHVIIGGRSNILGRDDRARLAAREGDRLQTHVLAKAGHWVHADDPDGVVAVLRDALELA